VTRRRRERLFFCFFLSFSLLRAQLASLPTTVAADLALLAAHSVGSKTASQTGCTKLAPRWRQAVQSPAEKKRVLAAAVGFHCSAGSPPLLQAVASLADPE